MEEQGFSHDQCLDFDFAVVDFWEDFYQPASDEKVKAKLPSSQSLKPGQGWIPRYKTRDEILELWLKKESDGSDDPIAQQVDLDAVYDAWDPDEDILVIDHDTTTEEVD